VAGSWVRRVERAEARVPGPTSWARLSTGSEAKMGYEGGFLRRLRCARLRLAPGREVGLQSPRPLHAASLQCVMDSGAQPRAFQQTCCRLMQGP
jgi:hypothetical protein